MSAIGSGTIGGGTIGTPDGSAHVAYDPALLAVQRYTGRSWVALATASVTVAKGYDVGETGVLLVAPDTCDLTLSRWDNERVPDIAIGTRIRVTYSGRTLFTGLVAGTTTELAADPDAAAHGATARIDQAVNAVGTYAELMTATVRWRKTLPAEPAATRLRRFLTTLEPGDAPNPKVLAEDPGSSTVLEQVNAYCAAVGRPVRLTSATSVAVVPAGRALPNGYIAGDGANMYARVRFAREAGDKVISLDTRDQTFSASADLVTDDARLLLSGWQLPAALPVPFADPAVVSRWTTTLTPDHLTGSLEFYTATARVARPRLPAPHRPGSARLGEPWDAAKRYPPDAVVTKDGHLYRAPAGADPGAVPGAVAMPSQWTNADTGAIQDYGLWPSVHNFDQPGPALPLHLRVPFVGSVAGDANGNVTGRYWTINAGFDQRDPATSDGQGSFYFPDCRLSGIRPTVSASYGGTTYNNIDFQNTWRESQQLVFLLPASAVALVTVSIDSTVGTTRLAITVPPSAGTGDADSPWVKVI